MSQSNDLRKFIKKAINETADTDSPRLEQVKRGRDGARDVTLAYIHLDKIKKAKQWASVAVPDYVKYCRFAAEHKLDRSSPLDLLVSQPWADAITAIQLATFASDDDLLSSVAEMVSEWATLDFLDECRGWEKNLRIEAASILALFILDEPYNNHYETIQSKFDAMESPTIYAQRDYHIANAIVGTASGETEQVRKSCKYLDEYHESLDEYESTPMEIVNINSCFCVAIARQHGLDVNYTSDYVPDSLQSY